MKNAPAGFNSTNGGKILINQPCHLTRAGKTRIVTPRRRVVMGGRWTVENTGGIPGAGGRRCYRVNCRWEVEYIVTYTDWQGVVHIVVATDFAAEWELAPVASMELEAA